MPTSRTVVIAGAGIGGLTAALALAERQFRVIVLEKATRLREVGAGLQLSPNATHVLTSLGVDVHLNGRAVSIDAVRIVSARNGREIVRIPFAEAAARFGSPYWIVHRADLQSALLARVAQVPSIELHLGCSYEDCAISGDSISVVRAKDGHRSSIAAAALIGADGVRSAVRRQFFKDAQLPRFSGFVAFRGTCDADRLPGHFRPHDVQLWIAPDAHLVAYPVSGGARVNVVVISRSTWNKPGWSESVDGSEVRSLLSPTHWGPAIAPLARAIGGWTKWAMFAMPDCVWARDRVALIGDASHAMLPFAAQGAGMAIEDAAVLARCLTNDVNNGAQATRH